MSSLRPTANSQSGRIAYLSLQSRYHNFGDYLLLDALIDRLAKDRNLVVRVDGVPEYFVDSLLEPHSSNVKRVSGLLLGRALTQALLSWLPVARSGRIELWFKPGHKSLSKTSFHHYVHGLALRVLSMAGGRSIRLGVSISPKLPTSIRGERFFLRSFDVFGCRDQDSCSVLKSLDCDAVTVTPDFIFAESIADFIAKQAALEARSSDREAGNVGVSFRDPELLQSSPYQASYGLRTAIHSILESSVFASGPDINVMGQVRGDVEFSESLFCGMYGSSTVATFVPGVDAVSDLSKWYSKQDLVLTNRLHVWLLALMHGIPAFALINPTTQTKISSYAAELGLSHLVLDFRDEETIPTHISEMLLSLDGKGMSDIRLGFQDQTARLSVQLQRLLGDGSLA